MNIKKINFSLLTISFVLILFSISIKMIAFLNIKAPEFKKLISARIIGTDERNMFIEMIWELNNVSNIPYSLRNSEMFFFESENKIASIVFDDKFTVKSFSSTSIKINVTLDKRIFEKLVLNYIDSYSFHLQGNADVRFLFFSKKIFLNQFIPVNIKSLINDFLIDGLKNFFQIKSVESHFENEKSNLIFKIDALNRISLPHTILSFKGKVFINKEITGTVYTFSPVQFIDEINNVNTELIFKLDNKFETDIVPFRYFIKGFLEVRIWDNLYDIPFEMIGEI